MREVLEQMICRDQSVLVGYERLVKPADDAEGTYYRFDTLRVIRVVSGCAQWQIGNTLYPLSPDDIVLLNNLESRALQGFSAENPLVLEVFAFALEIVRYEEECLLPFYGRTSSFRNVLRESKVIKIYLDMLRSEINASVPSMVLLSSLITCLCIELRREVERTQPEALNREHIINSSNMLTIADAAAYIQNHLSDDLTVESLAKFCHLSPGYFSHLFREQLGVSVTTFINRCRVEQVIRQLRTSDTDVLEAAFQCGFRSSSGFYRAFRAETGASPLAYIKKV